MRRTNAVLIIDDDAAIRDLIVEVLTDEGYIAYSGRHGTSALTAIARNPPALLLLDMRMPGLSSTDLIARVREVGLATMPIVVMTTAPRDVAPLLVPEAIEFLAKPFDIDDLLAHVARYVQPAQAVDQPLVLHAT